MLPVIPELCYYEALSVEKTASREEIVLSYRYLARIHHPDKNPNDADATARFQRIQAAHKTLADPTKCQRYDHLVASPAGPSNRRPFFEDEEDDDDDNYEPQFTFFSFRYGYVFFNGGYSYDSRQTERHAAEWERQAECRARQARQKEEERDLARLREKVKKKAGKGRS